MDIWTAWLDSITALLTILSSGAGLSVGLAIIVTTVLLRTALLPLSWTIAYRARLRQKKLTKLQPELRALQTELRNVVPSLLAVVAALQFSSALAIYWVTSNTFSAIQIVLLQVVVRRRAGSGAIQF